MKVRFVVLCVAISLLGGCGLNDALDQMSLEGYQKQCDRLGFKQGTEAYSNCLLKQQQMDNDNNQRSMDRSSWEQANQKNKKK
jgi:hypothetical protein